jgi:hypothetical protein
VNEEEKSAFVGHIPELVQEVFGPVVDFYTEIIDYVNRSTVLARDVAKCNCPLRKGSHNQFWRRTIVKNIFAVLEAACFGFKAIAFQRFRHYEIDFSSAEVAILLEHRYMLLDNGEVRTVGNNFQRFIPNLKFAFKCFAKAHGLSYVLDISKVPLKEFEELRNRITHPKKLTDLTITDAELTIAYRIWTWFSDEQLHLVRDIQLQQPLKVKLPPMPKSRVGVTKDYVVLFPDGNVFQFEMRKVAMAFKKSHTAKGAIVKPVLVKRTDLPP